MSRTPRLLALAAFLLPLAPCLLRPAHAIDIEGVLPASLDQPRVYLAVSTTRDGLGMAIDNIRDGAFSFIAIDHANRTLGATTKK